MIKIMGTGSKGGGRLEAGLVEPVIHKGLRDVFTDTTTTTHIDGGEPGVREANLQYRGYNIDDLVARSTFEETAFLIMKGRLPTQRELNDFIARLRDYRSIPGEAIDIIRMIQHAEPMDVLRTVVSSLSAFNPQTRLDSIDAIVETGMRLMSQVPIIVMAHHHIREGRGPVPSDPNLSYAANFLFMHNGSRPSYEAARVMDIDFILHGEHGLNASSFAARVATSAYLKEADVYGAITAAIATLKGPAHGGAAGNIMGMVEEIGDPKNAASYVMGKFDRREPVMGFGHRVYKTEDPRARHLREGVRKLCEQEGQQRLYEILIAIEEAMKEEVIKRTTERPGLRGIAVNVDFYAGALYHLMGFENHLFVPIFAVGRVPGLTAQIAEQFANNDLIRPQLQYKGPLNLPYTPIQQR